jgi:hypothetical protein
MLAAAELFRLWQQRRKRFFLWFLAACGQKPKKKKSFSTLPEPALSPATALGVNSVEWGDSGPFAGRPRNSCN